MFDHGVAGTGEDVFIHGVAGTGDDVFASADFTPIAPQTTSIATKTTDFFDIRLLRGETSGGVYFKLRNAVKESFTGAPTPPPNWPGQHFFQLSPMRLRSRFGTVNVTKVLWFVALRFREMAHF